MTPSKTTMFVREASTCAMQDGTNASRETWFFATQPGPRIVRVVHCSRNAVPAISIVGAACCAPWRPRP